MTDIRTDWEDNAGQVEDAEYLNGIGIAINANTHARPLYGAFTDRPAATDVTAGTPYFCSDNNVLYRSDGTNWIKVRIGADSCGAMGNVPTTGWTAVNMQAGASWAADKDDMLFTIPSTGTSAKLQYQYRAYPTPPFSLTTLMDFTMAGDGGASTAAAAEAGIVISDGTKSIFFGAQLQFNPQASNALTYWVAKVANYSTNTSRTAVNAAVDRPKWLRFTDDGTNLTYRFSNNGVDWTTVSAGARTAFLTPARIGVGGSNYYGFSMLMRVRSWDGVA